jgi:hypothetical protein
MDKFVRFNRFTAAICLYAMVLGTIAPSPALARGRGKNHHDWDNVLRLGKGDKLYVLLFSKKTYSGSVDHVEPGSLAMNTAAGSLALPKEDIKSITRIGKPKLFNPGLWVALGGVTLASTSEFIQTTQDVVTLNGGRIPANHSYTILIAGLAAAAAGVVMLVFLGKPRQIYEAKAVPSQTAQ